MGATAGAIRSGRAFVELFADDSKMQAVLKRSQVRLLSFSDFVRTVGLRMASLGSLMTVPFIKATSDYAKFDDQMREVAGVVSATNDELAMLTKTARRLAQQRGTSFLATDIGALMAELGRSGFAAESVNRMTKSVLLLARATKTELPIASKITGSTLRQYNLGVEQTENVTDLLAKTANASATSVESLGSSLEYAGKPAYDLGYSLQETLAIIGTLGNLGIVGTEAGTAVRRLGALTAAESDKMQSIFGVAFRGAKGQALPLIDVLERVSQSTEKLGSSDRMKKYNDAFGILGITSAIALGASAKSARSLVKELDNVAGYARRAADAMDGGIGGSLRRMWASLFEGELSVGNALEKHLIPIIDKVTISFQQLAHWVQENPLTVTELGKSAVAIAATGAGVMGLGVTGGLAALNLRGIGYALHFALTPARLLSDTLGGVLSVAHRAEKLSTSWAGMFIPTMSGGGASGKGRGKRSAAASWAPDVANLLSAVMPGRFLPAKNSPPGMATKLTKNLGLNLIRRKKAGKPGEVFKDLVGLDFEQLQAHFMSRGQRLRASIGRGFRAVGGGFMGGHRAALGMLGGAVNVGGLTGGSFAGMSGFLGRVGQGFPRFTSQLASLAPASGLLGGITMPLTEAAASIFRFGSSAVKAAPGVASLGRSIYGLAQDGKTMAGTKAFAGMATGGASIYQFARSAAGRMASTAGASMLGPANLFRFATGRSTMRLRPGSLGKSGLGNSETNILGRTTALGASAVTASLGLLSRYSLVVARVMPSAGIAARLMANGFRQAHEVTMTLGGLAFEKLRGALGKTSRGLGALAMGASKAFMPLMRLSALAGGAMFSGLVRGVGLLLNPMTLLLGAGVAVVANWDRIKGAITRVVTTAPGALSSMWGRMKADAMPTLVGIKDTALLAFGGITEALQAGDMMGAANILWAGLKGVWNQGSAYLMLKWTDLKAWGIDSFYGIQQAVIPIAASIANFFDLQLFDWFGIRLSDVTSAFFASWEWIKSAATLTAGWIQEKWHSAFGGMGQAGESTADKIWNAFEWLRKKLAQVMVIAMKTASITSKVATLGLSGFDFNVGDALEALDDQFAKRTKDRTLLRANVKSGVDVHAVSRAKNAAEVLAGLEAKRLANKEAAANAEKEGRWQLERTLEHEKEKLDILVKEARVKRDARNEDKLANEEKKNSDTPTTFTNTNQVAPEMPKGLTPASQRRWVLQQQIQAKKDAAQARKDAVSQAEQKKKDAASDRRAANLQKGAGGFLKMGKQLAFGDQPPEEPGEALFFDEKESVLDRILRLKDNKSEQRKEAVAKQINDDMKLMEWLKSEGFNDREIGDMTAKEFEENRRLMEKNRPLGPLFEKKLKDAVKNGDVKKFERNKQPAADLDQVRLDLKSRAPNLQALRMAGLRPEMSPTPGSQIKLDQSAVTAKLDQTNKYLVGVIDAIRRVNPNWA